MRNDLFYILSIDGGGIRGVFSAHVLYCIQEKLDVSLLKQFQMFAGTSSGSIIAAAIVCNIPIKEVLDLYKEYSPKIFASKSRIKFFNLIKSAVTNFYSKQYLTELLDKIVGEKSLEEIKTPLLIPATNVGLGTVHVFKSSYSSTFVRDKGFSLKKAILSSCSAPIFFTPEQAHVYLLADGGLWVNNPSLAAVIEAKKNIKIDLDNIRVLSIGTGHQKTCYGVNLTRRWGLMTGWGGKSFIDFIFSLQSQATENYLKLLLKKDQILRIDFESDKEWPLDDYTQIGDLLCRADHKFSCESEKIRQFLLEGSV